MLILRDIKKIPSSDNFFLNSSSLTEDFLLLKPKSAYHKPKKAIQPRGCIQSVKLSVQAENHNGIVVCQKKKKKTYYYSFN